ncbi:MAG: ribosome maturation factor RimM [Prevotella sp.]|nr:16S rRNA processing protein RimM [Prevotella sp.]MCR5152659.1 ribosome maturation factor RimM [Prevotella sp.]
MIRKDEVYKIGRVGKPHGVKGEVTMYFNDDVFDRVDADYVVIDVDGILVPFFFDEYRFSGNETALVIFDGIDSVEAARYLTGCDVYFPYSLADSHDEGGVSWSMLTGFSLLDTNGTAVGTIDSVDTSTENYLFCVTMEDGREILIPAAEELIKDINIEDKSITVILPDGILDMDL